MRMHNPNTGKFWDKLIKTNQKILMKSPIYRAKNKIVFNYIRSLTGKILDIGVGYGHLEKEIVDNKLNLKIYGIDIAKESIKKLSLKYGKGFKEGKIDKIPFRSNFFDCVLILDVLEHIRKDKLMKSLKEVKRVMSKNAILIVSVPMNDTHKDSLINGHLRRYTDGIISSELTRSGFLIKRKHVLFAFKNLFFLKNLLIKCIPFISKKPNLIILLAQKI